MQHSRFRASALGVIAATLAMITIGASNAGAQHQHGAKQDSMPKHEMKHDMSGGMKEHETTKWKEMDAFHAVMHTVVHPATEQGDLAPLRARAADLTVAAKAWAGSAAPATCAGDATSKEVAGIATSSEALAAKVKSGASDAELKASLTALHTAFEALERHCGAMKEMKH